MNPDVGCYNASHSSGASSRHGSESYSPNHGNMTTGGFSQAAYAQMSNGFQYQQYSGASQAASIAGSPYSNRRLRSTDDFGRQSRDSSHAGTTTQGSPRYDSEGTQHSSTACTKDKGKQKDVDSQASRDRQTGSLRHGSGNVGGSRRYGGDTSDKLVSGVFIRY